MPREIPSIIVEVYFIMKGYIILVTAMSGLAIYLREIVHSSNGQPKCGIQAKCSICVSGTPFIKARRPPEESKSVIVVWNAAS